MSQPLVYEITLNNLTYGGDALGHLPDGKAVFVPFALPGERVRLRLTEEKRGHARAELVEVLEPSGDRVLPRCKHYTICGGCQYQHLSYTSQLHFKTIIVRDLLELIGGVIHPNINPAVPSEREWYYRNAVQFHLDEKGKVGYLAAASHNVVPISECHLPEEPLNALWPLLDMEALPGLERVELRLGSHAETMIVLESNDPQPPEFTVDMPVSAVYDGPDGPVVLAGDQSLIMDVLGRSFQVSAPSFFQVNTWQAEEVVKHLLSILPLTSSSVVLDVYCGVGLFSAFLAPRVKRVIGIELSPSACEDFAANLDEFENVDLYVGPAEEILPTLKANAEMVVVNPPRSGVERAALQALVEMAPVWIAYISCDPATLARDAHRLVDAGYTLQQVTPFDFFPQTYHIETISLFKTKGSGAGY